MPYMCACLFVCACVCVCLYVCVCVRVYVWNVCHMRDMNDSVCEWKWLQIKHQTQGIRIWKYITAFSSDSHGTRQTQARRIYTIRSFISITPQHSGNCGKLLLNLFGSSIGVHVLHADPSVRSKLWFVSSIFRLFSWSHSNYNFNFINNYYYHRLNTFSRSITREILLSWKTHS